MPYIKQELRDELHMTGRGVQSGGELNYALTCICLAVADGEIEYEEAHQGIRIVVNDFLSGKDVCYELIRGVMGDLDCAQRECMRRKSAATPIFISLLEDLAAELYEAVAGPYEDLKIKENGDVYTEFDFDPHLYLMYLEDDDDE